MNSRRASRTQCALAFVLAACALTAVSCGGPPGHYKVTGKVLCNGKPAEGVDIQFNPKGDVGSDPHIAHATSDESGSFSLECRDGPGALPGEYMVALRLMDYNTATARKQRKRVGGVRMKNYPEDALKGRFSDPKNPQYPGYTASITAGTNELPPFEITLDQKEFNEFFGQ